MGILQAILIAVSLCADCFAVSLCSGVTLKESNFRSTLKVAIAFGVIQAGLLTAGWALGSAVVGLVDRISHIIGFLLLLYVGGEMLIEGIKGEIEAKDLNGFRNVVIGGVATSIDALAVGAAQSLAGADFNGVASLIVAVLLVTIISVIAGIQGGHMIGKKCGRWAEIAGGTVLLAIGISLLF